MDPHARRMRHSSLDPNWRTPPAFVQALQRIFPIQVDLAADFESAAITDSGGVTHYFGPDHPAPVFQDALACDWHKTAYSCGFLNPPYSITRIKELRASFAELTAVGHVLDTAKWEAQLAAFRIDNWARKAFYESIEGFTTIGVFPYSPQTKWFKRYVMGHTDKGQWSGHAALDFWRLPHRVPFLKPDGSKAGGANVNTCVIIWGPNPGFVGPWVPSGRYWTYRQPKEGQETTV